MLRSPPFSPPLPSSGQWFGCGVNSWPVNGRVGELKRARGDALIAVGIRHGRRESHEILVARPSDERCRHDLIRPVYGGTEPEPSSGRRSDREEGQRAARSDNWHLCHIGRLYGLSGAPCKDGDLQWVRVPPGKWSLQPEAVGAVRGGN